MDIPKARQYDNGKVEVIARNSAGEAYACVDLTVTGRNDDFRNVLKNSPRRESICINLVASFQVEAQYYYLQLTRFIILMVYILIQLNLIKKTMFKLGISQT
jgi:hypothetical protein